MRSLAAALLAAQKARSRRPYITVTVRDRQANIRRLRLASWYSGSEAAGPHAACCGSDGSLNRFRVEGTTLYRSRVATPAVGSDYSVWVSLSAVVSGSPVACMVTGSTVTVFYMSTSTAVKYRVSSDNGASWGAEQALGTAAGTVAYLAAAAKNSTTALLVLSVGSSVYRSKMVSGSWGALGAWTNSVDSVSGLACHYLGDWNLLVAGVELTTLAPTVWEVLYGDGFSQSPDSWSSLLVTSQAASGSGVAFSSPFVGRPDVYRLSYREAYAGSGAYSRLATSHQVSTSDFAANQWREPEPVAVDVVQGLAWSSSGVAAYLTSASRVYFFDLAVAAVELASRVVALDLLDRPLSEAGGWIDLDNADGELNADQLGAGSYAALRLGGEVAVGLGYRTASGDLTSAWPLLWIDGLEHVREAGGSRLRLHLLSVWGLSGKVVPARPVQYGAGGYSVLGLLARVLSRAGVEVAALSSSPGAAAMMPAFVMRPGGSVGAALRSLLELVEDELRPAGGTGGVYTLWPQPSDASVYSYGVSGDVHLVLSGSHRQSARGSHAVALGVGVAGAPLYGESLDFGAQGAFYESRAVSTRAVASATEAGYVASAVGRREAIAGRGDEVLVPVNCGQELWDVVDVTDPALGYSASERRVVGLRVSYERGARGRYDMRLWLGGV
ncbi:MAG TPA: hypothetical protein VJL31_10190 [Gemmatimonadales bacterium]|nr:hypothetical protein [Gemmatimonadales bacterium]